MTTNIFISGATGYVAREIIGQAISKGYNVVGSVRSVEKGERLKKSYGDQFNYEVVEVLEREGAFDEALKKHPEVTIFLHTASPAIFSASDLERDILAPAIQGTKYVLQSIHSHAPQVERVVYTSSWGAIVSLSERSNPKFVGGEDVWNTITYEESKIDGLHAYYGSKTFAERAAWEFVENNKPNFTLTAVNPVMIFGPQPRDEDVTETLNMTAEVVNSVLKLKKGDVIPKTEGNFVDVRDVGRAHLIAFESDQTKGQRIIVRTQRFSFQRILDIVRENFPQFHEKLPEGEPHNYDFSIYSEINDKKSQKILGFEHISLEKSVIDSIEQVLRVNKSGILA
ncbi:protein induced by osmotic stress [Scheffersomyces xylosifermentans]|uniref:protein induced by osmotic stress n=1 Tax=Scheffersomyces xylosifermentans TaxID=1304137 RepID=UPI00315DB772